ncbi:hypothetical protein HY495_00355 [Candidatus Woesearchaeota archaeon]|nr:hypothetical protein [Candidatus Woesearchaeota archaeon]
MLERYIHPIIKKTVAAGIAALVFSACTAGTKKEEIEKYVDGNPDAITSVIHQGYIDVNPENEDNVLTIPEVPIPSETKTGRGLPETERVYGEEALPEKRVPESMSCDESSPCLCDSIEILSGKNGGYFGPVVADYTIAFENKDKEISLLDIPGKKIVSLAPLKGEKLRLESHHLSGVYSGTTLPGNCQMINLISGEVVYDGLCPADIDNALYVTLDHALKMVVGNASFDEEVAAIVLDSGAANIVFDHETIAFAGKNKNAGSAIYLWRFIDESLFFLPQPEGTNDYSPLVKDNALLFSRYEADGTIKLMLYDFIWDDVFELFSSLQDYTTNGAFNGRTLAARVAGNQLEAYNLVTGQKSVVDTEVEGVPSLDDLYLVWTKDQGLRYCELKEEWKP